MYNVMLVDDDYPVLELLSETVEWEKLGLRLQSVHENGASALSHALKEMPDILITDIGMPEMNGIELTKKLKQRKPNLQVAILSCHSEFTFAQQALRLNVQEYILKDTLDLDDLRDVLLSIRESLEKEKEADAVKLNLQRIVERNKELSREEFVRKTVHQPIYDDTKWYAEARTFGLQLESTAYFPVLCFIHHYRSEKQRFSSEDTLQFAVANVIREMLHKHFPQAVYFYYGINESFILFPYHFDLKTSDYDKAADSMKHIQSALRRSLGLSMSFIVGEVCCDPNSFKQELADLLFNTQQRFYVQPNAIEKKRNREQGKDGLFYWYDQAVMELRELFVKKDKRQVAKTVTGWIKFMGEECFPPEAVKGWVLKLLLDIKVELKDLHLFHSSYTTDTLHREIFEIGSLSELKDWLISYLESSLTHTGEHFGKIRRREILDACHYVVMNLDKKISLEEIAGHLYLNPSYFSRLFKKEVGETFVEYVTKTKMKRAKELLDVTSDSVGEVAQRLGYDNQSYFIKLFKDHVGVTPMEYRIRHKNV